MTDSAALKINYAAKRISELNELFRKQPPFLYVLETDTKTGERAIFAKKNEAVIHETVLIAGDIVHNLRSALDHAYWTIASPFATNPREEKAIQFPFSETKDRLHEAIANRLAKRVSQRFFDALVGLKPYFENGGNKMLCLIDGTDVPDKHRTLTPVGEYKTISSETMRRIIPDFPPNITNLRAGMNYRDVGWSSPWLRMSVFPPFITKFETVLDYHIDIVFLIPKPDFRGPIIPTLYKLVDTARETISVIRDAAK